jgi:formylglycine-generating enzyme required for sulfatase activity
VRSFEANAFRLYDLDGNVSEWVEDCWHDNFLRAPDTPIAWVNPGCELRVVRGGSWGSAREFVRSAWRSSALTASSGARTGFRVARDL